ncbi:TPA: hypothetical protein JIU96_11305 [Acinetobacter baumannii]|nr:hypothetical protein [Acinetobacter baumannii]HAV4889877.1 hypothetical protein [Acinetobacter baumannii]HAV4905870.1 hypothetical protein [Acinetobacter baumannii]HAV4911388.1 hypothetical protein [Acinetobacter baumannii]HAV4921355.1 hypothetical protein [Acinetobacter baumannii]
MSQAIKSDTESEVTKVLPNLLDFPMETAKKTSALKRLLASANGDPSLITDANSDSILLQLNTHRTRVANDGGIVLSVPNTLKAIMFALQNGLSTSNYSAFSPDFGVKLLDRNGNAVIKLYDLAGRDMKVLSGSFEKAKDQGNNVLKNTNTATLISENFLTGGQGMLLGASIDDADAGSSASQAVKGMFMSDNATASGQGVGYLESNRGGVSRFYYKRASDSTMLNLGYDQTSNYKKYSGLVGYISNSNNKVEIYENGVKKQETAVAPIDLTTVNIYPVISALSLNSSIRESWLVKSTSQILAIALSSYLNKSI